MSDTFFIELGDLWVDVERIIAIRATDDGQASTLYCEDAASFRVKLTPEQIIRKIEDAVLPAVSAAGPVAVPAQYVYTAQIP